MLKPLAALTLLAACSAPERSVNACPAPIWPDKCAVEWIEKAQTPACFNDWLDKIERQQELLGR